MAAPEPQDFAPRWFVATDSELEKLGQQYREREKANDVAILVGKGGCRAHVLAIVDVYLPRDPQHIDVESIRRTAELLGPPDPQPDDQDIPF